MKRSVSTAVRPASGPVIPIAAESATQTVTIAARTHAVESARRRLLAVGGTVLLLMGAALVFSSRADALVHDRLPTPVRPASPTALPWHLDLPPDVQLGEAMADPVEVERQDGGDAARRD